MTLSIQIRTYHSFGAPYGTNIDLNAIALTTGNFLFLINFYNIHNSYILLNQTSSAVSKLTSLETFS